MYEINHAHKQPQVYSIYNAPCVYLQGCCFQTHFPWTGSRNLWNIQTKKVKKWTNKLSIVYGHL